MVEANTQEVTTKKILVIEDEPDMLMGLEHNLSFEGYAVATASTGRAGLDAVKSERPDIVLLDVMLPEMSGFDVLRAIREESRTLPVIMITAKGMESDKVQGFSLGADDYVTKPFSIRELMARISAVLRRSAGVATQLSQYSFGDVEVDFEKRECRRKGREVALSFKEFEVLRLLIENRGQTITRERLLEEVWGLSAADQPTSRTVDTHIANLRRKLEGDRDRNKYVRTVHKVGYKFVDDN
ncbi:MAG: response regulator transcription factor [Candidatus Eisenbacteria bacterium]|uniref:Response regulator transcription factor n=1 Tax=Eiseniibacteriota bacterium TaxID=2212470 RepID=A0A7Y2H216_UNCEI|nr:response regulator transcription factor [Candidatus Eisenbacteria bacterium]